MSLFLFPILYHFVNLNFICNNNNNLCIHPLFHFRYNTDEEIIDFEIYLSIISNDMILMLLYPHNFKWFFDIHIYIYNIYIYIYIYNIYIYIYIIYIYIIYIYIYIYIYIHIYIYIYINYKHIYIYIICII